MGRCSAHVVNTIANSRGVLRHTFTVVGREQHVFKFTYVKEHTHAGFSDTMKPLRTGWKCDDKSIRHDTILHIVSLFGAHCLSCESPARVSDHLPRSRDVMDFSFSWCLGHHFKKHGFILWSHSSRLIAMVRILFYLSTCRPCSIVCPDREEQIIFGAYDG